MHTTVVPHHSENKPFQILNYYSAADCTGTSNFLTNRHLNNDVFSFQALQPFKGESFHSLERDLHSNSSLKGLESPSNNSMIIGPCHSQWFFSQRTGKGGMRRKQEDSTVYFRQFILQPHQNSKYYDLQSRACYLELWRSPVKMDRHFALIIHDEWRLTKTLHSR